MSFVQFSMLYILLFYFLFLITFDVMTND